MSLIGVPLKVLHEAEGHIITIETTTGEVTINQAAQSFGFSIYLSIYLFIYLFIYISVHLSLYLSI